MTVDFGVSGLGSGKRDRWPAPVPRVAEKLRHLATAHRALPGMNSPSQPLLVLCRALHACFWAISGTSETFSLRVFLLLPSSCQRQVFSPLVCIEAGRSWGQVLLIIPSPTPAASEAPGA